MWIFIYVYMHIYIFINIYMHMQFLVPVGSARCNFFVMFKRPANNDDGEPQQQPWSSRAVRLELQLPRAKYCCDALCQRVYADGSGHKHGHPDHEVREATEEELRAYRANHPLRPAEDNNE